MLLDARVSDQAAYKHIIPLTIHFISYARIPVKETVSNTNVTNGDFWKKKKKKTGLKEVGQKNKNIIQLRGYTFFISGAKPSSLKPY